MNECTQTENAHTDPDLDELIQVVCNCAKDFGFAVAHVTSVDVEIDDIVDQFARASCFAPFTSIIALQELLKKNNSDSKAWADWIRVRGMAIRALQSEFRSKLGAIKSVRVRGCPRERIRAAWASVQAKKPGLPITACRRAIQRQTKASMRTVVRYTKDLAKSLRDNLV